MNSGRSDPSTSGPTATPAQRSQTDSLTPPRVPDHELICRIGCGAYGEVWLARNVVGTLRAVKVVYRRSFSEAYPFERELKGIQNFEPISRSHEGLVDVLQIGRGEGYFYYVMELADDAEPPPSDQCSVVSNQSRDRAAPQTASATLNTDHRSLITSFTPRTLRHELKQRGRLPPAECLQIALTLSSALEHLHQHGLVHRDIKPSNIIFVGGTPKLADIGLVADVDEARSFVGTVGFIAPEGPGSPQADVYSLGKVLYEMVTGKDRQEFPGLPVEFQSNDSLPLKELNQIMLRSCEGDRRLRYPLAQAMHEDLTRVARGQPIKASRAWRRRFAIAAGVSLVLLALVAGVVALSVARTGPRSHTPNPEAVRLYEMGRWHHQQLTDESLKKAIECLSLAVQLDPDYVPPYTALLGIYTWKVPWMSEEESSEKIKRIAAKLLSLDPGLAEGHVALAYSKYLEGHWHIVDDEMQKAVRLNPNYAQARIFYCYFLSLLGRVEEAKIHGRRAQKLDPTSRIAATIAGYPFITAREYDLAITQFETALELDHNFALAHRWIGKAREAKGEYLQALAEFEKTAVLSGVDETKARQRFDTVRQTYNSSGPRGYWLKVLEFEEEAEASHEKPTVPEQDRWPLAGVYAQLGEKEKALDLLEKNYEEGDRSGWLQFEPLLEPLRDEPRFKALLKRAGLEK